jgi:hypothetical protein
MAASRAAGIAVATRADAPEPRSFGPYALAAAAIKGFSLRHPSRVNTAWGFLNGPDHGAGDRREEDLIPAVVAIMPGRAATGGHGRWPAARPRDRPRWCRPPAAVGARRPHEGRKAREATVPRRLWTA